MQDGHDARMWNEHHQAFSDWVVHAIQSIGQVFDRLHAHSYDAPWTRNRTDPSCG